MAIRSEAAIRDAENRRTRLRQWIDEHFGGSQAAFVSAHKLNQGEISALLKDKSFGGVKARNLEASTGMPERYLDERTSSVTSAEQSIHAAVCKADNEDLVRIPLLSNCGSMGNGNDLLDADYIVGDLALSAHWINQHIRPCNIRELKFIHAHGESMAPTFSSGDVLLVDVGSRDPSSLEGVYVLETNDKIFIKRVRMRMDGHLEVSSDNISIKTVDVLNGDHPVRVLGRVVWAWNGKKL